VAVVTDSPASGSGAKSDFAAKAWDRMNALGLANIQISVKPVHLYSVTAVSTTKEAWDALKDILEARDNARRLQLIHELRTLKKGGDENTIKYTSRTKGIRQELSMLGNQVDGNVFVFRSCRAFWPSMT